MSKLNSYELEQLAACVRAGFVSGTHAIACGLFGTLRPGDTLLAVVGPPYDTLEEVIGLRGCGRGSLAEWGVAYREVALAPTGGAKAIPDEDSESWSCCCARQRPPNTKSSSEVMACKFGK